MQMYNIISSYLIEKLVRMLVEASVAFHEYYGEACWLARLENSQEICLRGVLCPQGRHEVAK